MAASKRRLTPGEANMAIRKLLSDESDDSDNDILPDGDGSDEVLQSDDEDEEDVVLTQESGTSSGEDQDDDGVVSFKKTMRSKDGLVQWSTQPTRQSQGRRTEMNIVRSAFGPTRYAIRNVDTASSAFKLLFKRSVCDAILKWTNDEGKLVYREKWQDLQQDELDRFLGILILAGAYKSCDEPIQQMWSKLHGRPIFSAAMPRNRFTRLTRVLRFDDAASRRLRREHDKLAPIREVFENWTKNLAECYELSDTVTVDKQLVTFRGRCPFKQYIPSKPGKYRIKFWMCVSE